MLKTLLVALVTLALAAPAFAQTVPTPRPPRYCTTSCDNYGNCSTICTGG